MNKKLLSLLLAGAMTLSLAACGSSGDTTESPAAGETTPAQTESGAPEGTTVKVGLICNGDENDQGYTYNFIQSKDKATEALAAEGITVEWVTKFNIGEDSTAEDANIELADAGCQLIINNSYGLEDYMLKVAPDYPNVQFVSCTNQQSAVDDLDNTHNAFAKLHQGSYVCGVAAGMKLNQLIQEGTLTEDNAYVGYVSSFPYPEPLSMLTSFYLGAKSVCPTVGVKVKYINSWGNLTEEANAAQALCDEGCKVITNYTDGSAAATTAQSNGAYYVGYTADVTSVAPEAAIISTRVDWSIYMEYAIRCIANGEEIAQDWSDDMASGAVVMTTLNEAVAAPGTADAIAKAEDDLAGGMYVFTGPLTGTNTFDGSAWSLAEGEHYVESDVASGGLSAPQFCWVIDGITVE
ncbi:BMP family ABC transporter substrate-binding protein [Intestinimonas massiliensis (ex Afouda et al. 2020)]|uniref:BMP family ABC transporter substrate-binding protein n=1 Tax=Intestinimonas massiliensis (ex Afouda et al. 2020) TaxID=1673721 RepID=UPI0010308CE1|nr:BMP family ABC transporter substrate-binding protein [Intestinimonas massiliensis (ex Afouda et al. 2020)]